MSPLLNIFLLGSNYYSHFNFSLVKEEFGIVESILARS